MHCPRCSHEIPVGYSVVNARVSCLCGYTGPVGLENEMIEPAACPECPGSIFVDEDGWYRCPKCEWTSKPYTPEPKFLSPSSCPHCEKLLAKGALCSCGYRGPMYYDYVDPEELCDELAEFIANMSVSDVLRRKWTRRQRRELVRRLQRGL